MTDATAIDVVVIGAGPGGYAAAIRCGQAGRSTVIVDKSRLGGTCLIRGCIPSKAIIHAAETYDTVARHAAKPTMGIGAAAPTLDMAATHAWKESIVDRLSNGVAGLLDAAGVRAVAGSATVVDGKTVSVARDDGTTERFSCSSLILATGSVPIELAHLPFGDHVISSTGALDLDAVPERLAVVGAGYIGLELGMAFAKLGAEVTFVEMGDTVLPAYDTELSTPVAKALRRRGCTVHLGARAEGLDAHGALQVATADGNTIAVPADNVLVTVGRRPATTGWGIDNLALDMDGPFVAVDATCQTSVHGVYAIGDLTGEPMLAHRATAQAEVAADTIAGHHAAFDPIAIPAVVFTDPEIVVVGHSPDEALAIDPGATVGRFPLRANGRTLSVEGDTSGFVRVVAGTDRRVLGVQIVGSHVAELQAAAVTAIEMGATIDDLVAIVQAHPSLGEAITEAAFGIDARPLHIPAPPS